MTKHLLLKYASEQKARHQTKWPKNNRPLPSGMRLKFLDNDNNNNDKTEENNHHSLWNRFLFFYCWVLCVEQRNVLELNIQCSPICIHHIVDTSNMFAFTFYFVRQRRHQQQFSDQIVLFSSRSKHITVKSRSSDPLLILPFAGEWSHNVWK